MTPLLIKLGASLLAILALAGFAKWLGLGARPRLNTAPDAQRVADMIVPGFAPVEIGIDRAGGGALMRDVDGRLLLVRPHGASFVGRLLDAATQVDQDHHVLTVTPKDHFFGATQMDLGPQATSWAKVLRTQAL